MIEFLINQDRNRVYPVLATSFFNIKENEGYGDCNLYMDKKFIGTYIDSDEALNEIRVIHNRSDEIYGANAYSENDFTVESRRLHEVV